MAAKASLISTRSLSFRDVEDLLAERRIVVSYETVRRWVNHFGPKIAADLRKRRPKPHTIWHFDEGVPRTHQQRWECGAA
jgi:transposase-like protein